VDFELCAGAKSCWKIGEFSIMTPSSDGMRPSDKICWYLIEFMFPSTNISLTNPLVETVSQTIIRKECFTARRMHLGLYSLPFWRQTLPFLLIGSVTEHSSLNTTLLQKDSQQVWYFLAQPSHFDRYFLFSRSFVCGTRDIYVTISSFLSLFASVFIYHKEGYRPNLHQHSSTRWVLMVSVSFSEKYFLIVFF